MVESKGKSAFVSPILISYLLIISHATKRSCVLLRGSRDGRIGIGRSLRLASSALRSMNGEQKWLKFLSTKLQERLLCEILQSSSQIFCRQVSVQDSPKVVGVLLKI